MRVRTRSAGFTVVEVIIAMLIVVIVIGALSLFVAGNARTAVASNANDQEQAAAARVFSYIKSNRGWIGTCSTTAGSTCKIAVPAAEQAQLLSAKALGKECSGASPFEFQLNEATATPVESSLSTTGAQGLGVQVPSYWRIDVGVVAPTTCDQHRLGLPSKPVVYEAAINSDGTQLMGSLTVQVCEVTNQVDVRVDDPTCASSGASQIKMAGVCDARFGQVGKHAGGPGMRSGLELGNCVQFVPLCCSCRRGRHDPAERGARGNVQRGRAVAIGRQSQLKRKSRAAGRIASQAFRRAPTRSRCPSPTDTSCGRRRTRSPELARTRSAWWCSPT